MVLRLELAEGELATYSAEDEDSFVAISEAFRMFLGRSGRLALFGMVQRHVRWFPVLILAWSWRIALHWLYGAATMDSTPHGCMVHTAD